jgi:hypothetical protein
MGWAFIWNYGKHKKKHEVCARVNKRPSSCLKDTLVARNLISNQVHTGTKTEVCEIFFSSFPFYFLHSLVIKFGRYFINESPLNVCRGQGKQLEHGFSYQPHKVWRPVFTDTALATKVGC